MSEELKCRGEFERWFSDEGRSPKSVERNQLGEYVLMSAAHAWGAWRSAWNRRQQVPEDVSKNAERYRWLRSIGAERGAIDWRVLGVEYQDVSAMDAVIDAAIRARGKQGKI